MPKMISLRNFRLETTKSHVILFEANVPKDVPNDVVAEAMAAGCAMADAADNPFYEDLSRAKVEFQGDLRRSLIYLAVQKIAVKNDTKDFGGDGTPKHDTVSTMLGFSVTAPEVLDVFQQYLQVMGDDLEIALHPNAINIERVMDADTKAELIELAQEFEVDADKAKGLTAKELRKLLLVKFSGVAG